MMIRDVPPYLQTLDEDSIESQLAHEKRLVHRLDFQNRYLKLELRYLKSDLRYMRLAAFVGWGLVLLDIGLAWLL